jgi:hypothetical protein
MSQRTASSVKLPTFNAPGQVHARYKHRSVEMNASKIHPTFETSPMPVHTAVDCFCSHSPTTKALRGSSILQATSGHLKMSIRQRCIGIGRKETFFPASRRRRSFQIQSLGIHPAAKSGAYNALGCSAIFVRCIYQYFEDYVYRLEFTGTLLR